MTEHPRGDRELARGAQAAGVGLVSGYPGSPATLILEELARAPALFAHWAPNEKVALEMAYGASLAGVRALAVMKGVGLNIALDPLATMALSGCNAGLVIAVGDDPGGWGSQNEQDSRHLARLAEVPLVSPVGVGQAAALMSQAFAWSEAVGTPVILHFCGSLALAEEGPGQGEEWLEPWVLPERRRGFGLGGAAGRDRWVVLPANVVAYHRRQHRRLRRLQALFEASPYDLDRGQGRCGVLAVGFMARKVLDVAPTPIPWHVLGLSALWPLPESRLTRWLSGSSSGAPLQRVLVLEEGSPFVEETLRALVQRRGIEVQILGRNDGIVPGEGELGASETAAALWALEPGLHLASSSESARAMPSRVPLCPDCPYRPTFAALLRAFASRSTPLLDPAEDEQQAERREGRGKFIVVGETGCMVRAHLPPMRLFDVKYSLGAGLGLGMGLAAADPARHTVAILGDSSFFHTDLNALPHAVQLNLPLTVLILDNGTTALTGGQMHPGSVLDERGQARAPVDLVDLVRACGVEPRLCHPEQVEDLEAALDEALSANGLRVLIIRSPCPKHTRG